MVTVIGASILPAGATTARQSAITSTPVQTSGQLQKSERPAALDHFELHFHNYFRSPVYIAITYLDESGACDDYGGWATKGWWKLDRGQEAYVVSTRNRNVGWYAESENRTVTWSGTYTSIHVPDTAFDSCLNISFPGWRQIGMRKLSMDSGYGVYTQRIDA